MKYTTFLQLINSRAFNKEPRKRNTFIASIDSLSLWHVNVTASEVHGCWAFSKGVRKTLWQAIRIYGVEEAMAEMANYLGCPLFRVPKKKNYNSTAVWMISPAGLEDLRYADIIFDRMRFALITNRTWHDYVDSLRKDDAAKEDYDLAGMEKVDHEVYCL